MKGNKREGLKIAKGIVASSSRRSAKKEGGQRGAGAPIDCGVDQLAFLSLFMLPLEHSSMQH
jgi:hypothetical protein